MKHRGLILTGKHTEHVYIAQLNKGFFFPFRDNIPQKKKKKNHVLHQHCSLEQCQGRIHC